MQNSKQKNLTQKQYVALMEQRYTVLQDLDNVLGIFAETAETIKFFEEFPDHQMVINAQNRLITQVNLSNSIHFSEKDVKDPLLIGNLNSLKTLAKEYFEELRKSVPFTDKIDHEADHYVNKNLNEKYILQQLPGVQSKTEAKFTPETLQKVFDAMNQMDNIMGNIRAGQKVDIPSKDQFLKRMKERQENAQTKLKQNFKKEFEESQQLKLKKKNKMNEEKELENQLNYKKNQDGDQDKQVQISVDNSSSQVNQVIMKHLVLIYQQIQQQQFSESAFQQILDMMKKETKDLIQIFIEIQKLFFQNSEMSKLFNRIIKYISENQAKLDLTGIYKSKNYQNDVKLLSDYIENLELRKQQEIDKNQLHNIIEKQTFNQQQNDLENGQNIHLVKMKIIQHLQQLLNQLKEYNQINESAYQQIIKKMKLEIEPKDLIPILEEIQNLFIQNSEMSRLFNRILNYFPQQNKNIYLLDIDRRKIDNNQIIKLQDYIKKLEQQNSQGETNQKIIIIDKEIIEYLKEFHKEFNYQDLSESDIQNIIDLMKQQTQSQSKDLILIFQIIQQLFVQNSEMSKLFNRIIKYISENQAKLYLNGIYRQYINQNDVDQLSKYIGQLEASAQKRI